MNIESYLYKKKESLLKSPQYRELCLRCIQPQFSCYCSHIKRFDPKINFVILIHPIEVRRRIATGRMSSLCLDGSFLITGQDYSQCSQVNHLVSDSQYQSMILYPGHQSVNLTYLSEKQKIEMVPPDKKLRIFVIDGTWATAKKMVRQSQNLLSLPRICFTPPSPSTFRVRKQPHPHCYSTIEAIHQTLELFGQTQGLCVQDRPHDGLLKVFDAMVEKQLEFSTIASLRKINLRKSMEDYKV